MSNSQLLLIKEIEDCSNQEFEDSLKLIKANLPKGEVCKREDFIEVIRQKLEGRLKPDNYHLRAFIGDNKVIAASSGYFMADINMGLIHYISVDKNIQSKGTGTLMREDLLRCFGEDASKFLGREIEGYLGEVKITNLWLKALQKKFNVLPLDFDYCQPDLGCGEVPLVLYFQPRIEKTDSLEYSLVKAIVKSIYENVYEIRDVENNETYKRFLRTIENKKYIGRKIIP